MTRKALPAVLLGVTLAVAAPAAAVLRAIQGTATVTEPKSGEAAVPQPVALLGEDALGSAILMGAGKSDARRETVAVEGRPFRDALRVTAGKKAPKGNATQLLLPISKPVAKGERVVARFWLRGNPAAGAGGRARVAFAFEERGGEYAKSTLQYMDAPAEWTQKEIAFVSAGDYKQGGANVVFRVAMEAQTVEIGGLTVQKVGGATAKAGEAAPTPAGAGGDFVGDFETGDTSQWSDREYPKTTPGQVVSEPVRNGKYALKSTLTYADFQEHKNKRCETVRYHVGKQGEEGWYAFSILLPEDWQPDPVFDIVVQLHVKPDEGEVWRSPFFSFEVAGGDWRVYNRSDPSAVSKPAKNGSGGTITSERLYQAPYSKGRWTDWVLHAKWSTGSDGLVEIWRDGQKVVTRTGPNCYNDRNEWFLKVGIYKPGYKSTSPAVKSLYHDAVRVTRGQSTLAAVSPPQP